MSNKLLFEYDQSGRVTLVRFNGTYYYYIRNGQRDILKLIDNNGTAQVTYSYDTWGKQISCSGTLSNTLGKLNPFRYRGYIYDEGTKWYYLRIRYYDPETGRFLSADMMLSTGQGVLGHNCYVYCRNNSPTRIDVFGKSDEEVHEGGLIGDGDEEESTPARIASDYLTYTRYTDNPIAYDENVNQQIEADLNKHVIAYHG